jgi:hypothetical protein
METHMTTRFRLLGAILAAACAATGAHAAPNLVANGGFETGDLTGWVQTGDPTLAGATCASGFGAGGSSCAAFFSTFGDTSGILQTLTGLTVGQTYDVSFAFESSSAATTGINASFGGQTLLDLTAAPAATPGYTDYSFDVVATSSTETLSFGLKDDFDFVELDDVNVSAVPEPGSLALICTGLVAIAFVSRRRSNGTSSKPSAI